MLRRSATGILVVVLLSACAPVGEADPRPAVVHELRTGTLRSALYAQLRAMSHPPFRIVQGKGPRQPASADYNWHPQWICSASGELTLFFDNRDKLKRIEQSKAKQLCG